MNLSERDKEVVKDIWRPIGYGLLAFTAVDIVLNFFPPDFMNPSWELGFIGGLVERSPLPLLGCLLIYFRGKVYRREFEPLLLWLITSACLLVGILYFLLVPLTISSTLRLGKTVNSQIDNQARQQVLQIEQDRQQLRQASPQQLNVIVAQLKQRGQQVPGGNPFFVKSFLDNQLQNQSRKVESEANRTKSQQLNIQLKNALKWIFGSMISGTLFIYVWRVRKDDWPIPTRH